MGGFVAVSRLNQASLTPKKRLKSLSVTRRNVEKLTFAGPLRTLI
jgi:hypothetical protein